MIRYATIDDKKEMLHLFNSAFGHDSDKLANDCIDCCFSNDYRKPHFVIKEIEGEVVGASAYSEELFTTCTWGISWVAVKEEYRHKGYGTELVNFCVNEIKTKIDTYAFVILGTFPNKTGLYENNDFQKIFSDADHGSLMIKKIIKE